MRARLTESAFLLNKESILKRLDRVDQINTQVDDCCVENDNLNKGDHVEDDDNEIEFYSKVFCNLAEYHHEL